VTQTATSQLAANEPVATSTPIHLAKTRRRLLPARMTWAVAISIVAVLLLTGMVVMADIIAPTDPTQINLRARLLPPFSTQNDTLFLLGTDATGRDLFSRVLHGGQVSLLVGATATILGLVIGAFIGVISGYMRGWLDEVLMYFIDVQLALPFVLLAVAVALVLGTSPAVLIGLAALSTVPLYARVVRAEVLSLREREFIIAARACGGSAWHIMWRHLMPNLIAPLLVLAALSVGRIILLESGLSFLGIGIQPPTPSWGGMINDGRDYLSNEWWVSTVPGVALLILTLSVGTIGDWLRDMSDVTTA